MLSLVSQFCVFNWNFSVLCQVATFSKPLCADMCASFLFSLADALLRVCCDTYSAILKDNNNDSDNGAQ